MTEFLELESKYDADNIDRLKFKELANSLSPEGFVYVESRDVYFIKEGDEFLRYRMPAANSDDKRAELTFKKKHTDKNNIVRTEVNLRVDQNQAKLVEAFAEGLGYKQNFSIYKYCDIYEFSEVILVYYSVRDDAGKYQSFIEIECREDKGYDKDQGMEIIQKYEKVLSPLGITAQKRKRLSLFEMYRK